MVAVTSSYKTEELTFLRRVLRQENREIEQVVRLKTMHKGEFGDMKRATLKK